MTNDSPSQQQLELDQLLAEILDQGRTEQNNACLETLLLDNKALQERYLTWMSLHFSLQIEYGFEKHSFSSLIPGTTLPATQTTLKNYAPPIPSCSTLAAQLIEHDDSEVLYETASPKTVSSNRSTGGIFANFRVSRLLPSSVAASVAIAGFLIAGVCGAAIATLSLERSWLFAGPELPTVAEIEAAEKWLAEKKELLGTIPDRLPVEPYMAWPEIQIADAIETVPSETPLQQGAINLKPLNGKAGVGYLVPLLPGHGLELVASSESREDNNIVVLELSADGKQTGRSTSFSNNQLRSKHDEGRHVGRMGYWVDFNHSSETRYYCIVGIQKVHGDGSESNWDWRYNDFKPFLENSNLLYLGWDDEFVHTPPDNVLLVDHDYNDASAVIRIRRPGEIEAARIPQVVTMPEIDSDEQLLEVSSADYTFRIEPGQSAVLHVTSNGSDVAKLALTEKSTGKIWWSCNNTDINTSSSMGLFGIENHTKEPLELVLACRHHARYASINASPESVNTEETKWDISPYRLDTQDDNYWEIGFEDRPESPKNVDWNDVRVCITWIR